MESTERMPAVAEARASRLSARRLDFVLMGTIVILDQITKAIVHARIGLHESVTVIPGLLDLTHVRNSGAAFGFLNAVEFPFKAVVIPLIALTALVAIAAYAARLDVGERGGRIGLALILGGAVGNLIDRARIGYVVDFVDFYRGDYHFWAFNVADAAISIGAVVILLDMMFVNRHASHTL